MPPPKRKRSERALDGAPRPSPHRPNDTMLGQHDREFYDGSNRGGRGGRGGGGYGRGARHNDRRDSFPNHHQGNRTGPPPSPTSTRPPSSSSATHQSSFSRPAPMAPPPTVAPSSGPVAPPTAQAQFQPPVMDPLPFYHYDILTDEKVAAWTQGGRQTVIQHGRQSREDVDVTELSSLFQEFVRSVVEGRLNATDAGDCVREMLGAETREVIKDAFSFEPHSLFLDTMAVMMDNEPVLLRPQLRDFLVATGVSTGLMRQILDAPLLQHLGLIRETFVKLGIRQSTNLLYRQANYNLMREESEGYSKLITELFTTSSNEPPTAAAVMAAFERTKGLIGTFDLDVGRVLDVTLDVFASVLIKQFRFFVKFLRVSSWWPRSPIRPDDAVYSGGLPLWGLPTSASWTTSDQDEAWITQRRLQRDVRFWERARDNHLNAFFELGGYEVADSSRLLESASQNENKMRRQWITATNTNPPSGNRTAAQLLGFKLRFYNSDARDPADVLPANLLYLSALLIKVGFVSLCDLYEHLWPEDQDMEALRERKMAELEEKERASRSGGGMNALMMAGALTDDTAPTLASRRDAAKADAEAKANGTAADAKPDLPEPMEQKVSLLICLLTIGAIPESLFLLGRFPWVLEAFPEILDRVHRILNHSLDKVHRESCPMQTQPTSNPTKLIADADQSGVPKGGVNVGRTPQKKFLRWPYPDKFDFADCQNYRFYWDEWADNVPICQTVDDVFTLCGSLLNVSGVNIGKDEGLLVKLARIGAKSLAEDKSEPNMARWHDLLRRLLVPALSHTAPNAAVVNAVWSLLSLYPTSVRYCVYAEWYEGQISRLPAMRSAFAKSRLETLGTMKRLSLTNLKEMAKALAKISLSSPGIVFKVALDQIESYANLIDAFVECARYFTDLAYDVLVWSLLSSLGKSRSRTQESSVLLTSKWLQALAKFSGQVFRRYGNMNPTPVIQYVNNQLLAGNSTDLVILKEFISSMGGIVQTIDFTDAQIMAMSGGPILRRQTLIAGQDKRFESAETAKRLMGALVQSGLARKILINMAQYRESAIYQVPEDEAHIKYLSSVVDDSHQILVQFLDFLQSHLDSGAFENIVPSVISLMNDYGLGVSIAFLIGRDGLADRMFPRSKDDTEKPAATAVISKDDEGDVAMVEVQVVSQASPVKDGDKKSDEPDKTPPTAAAAVHAPNNRKSDPILDTLQPIIDSVQSTKTDDVWARISPEFYVMFWTFQLGDLSVPTAQYSSEKNRIIREVEAINRDRSDMTRTGVDKKNQDKARLLGIAQTLLHEQKEHETRYLKNKIHITRRFKSWFPQDPCLMASTADAILEECLLPRLVVSAADAEYCHRMVRALHDWNAPNFRLMTLYERLFNANRIRSLIFDCTVREVEHVGRYLKLVLGDLAAWHKDKDTYEKEALMGSRNQKERTLVGFSTALDAKGKPQAFVEHDQFRDMLWEWHKNLNTALKAALGGMEWMHIRNAITVLKSVLDSFPAVDFMATKFVAQLKTITERESASKTASESEEGHRVDLSVAAHTALSELQKRKSKWVKLVTDFRPNLNGDKSSEPKSADVPPSLRATAPDFKPQPGAAAQDPAAKPLPRTTSIAISEDGEIKDSRPQGNSISSRPAPAVAFGTANDSIPSKPPPPASSQMTRDVNANRQDTRSPTQKPQVPLPPANPATKSSTLGTPPVGLPSKPNIPTPGSFTQDRFGHGRRDVRDPREGHPGLRESQSARDLRAPRDNRDQREPWDSRDARDTHQRDVREEHDWSSSRTDLPLRRSDQAPQQDHDMRPGNLPPPRPQPGHGLPPARPSKQQTLHNATSTPSLQRPHQQLQKPQDNNNNNNNTASQAMEPPMNPQRAAFFAAQGATDHGPTRGETRGWQSDRDNDQDSSLPASRHDMRNHRDARDRQLDSATPAGSFHNKRLNNWDDSRDQDSRRGGHMGSGTFGGPGASPPISDQGHRTMSHQDQNYGRLDPAPAMTDTPPSGPRGRGRGINRPPTSKVEDGRLTNESPRANSPDRAPPTGPSKGHRRFDSGPGPALPSPTAINPSTANLTPAEKRRQSKGLGLNAEPTPSTPVPTPSLAAPPSAPAIHPSRLGQLGGGGGGGGGAMPGAPPNVPPRGQQHQYPHQPPHHQNSQPSVPPSLSTRVQQGHMSRHSNSFTSGSPTDTAPTGPFAGRPRIGGNQPPKFMNDIIHTLQSQSYPKKPLPLPPRHLHGTDVRILAGGSPATPHAERFEPATAPVNAQHPADRIATADFDDSRGNYGGRHDRDTERDHDRDTYERRKNIRGGKHDNREREWDADRARDRSSERDRDSKPRRERHDTSFVGLGGSKEDAVPREREKERDHDRDRERESRLSRRSTRESLGGRDTPVSGGSRDAGRERETRDQKREPREREPREPREWDTRAPRRAETGDRPEGWNQRSTPRDSQGPNIQLGGEERWNGREERRARKRPSEEGFLVDRGSKRPRR